MGQILIRNIPDETIAAYKERARAKGRSLEQEIRDLLESQRTYTAEERIALSRRFRARCRSAVNPLTSDEYREGLE